MNERAREVSDVGHDDIVLPYAVEALSTRGRVVRLGPAIDAILKRHDYPEPVSRLLGRGGDARGAARLVAQARGALPAADQDRRAGRHAAGRFRRAVEPARARALRRGGAGGAAGRRGAGELLGEGYLAFTVDPGGELSRYQGVVALEGQDLQAAAHAYFERSEQIPTLVRLAVGQRVTPRRRRMARRRPAGAVPARLARTPAPRRFGPRRRAARDAGRRDARRRRMGRSEVARRDDRGPRADRPGLSSERLLFRLFNERGVRVFEPKTLADVCRCSAERIDAMLQSFSAEERNAMIGDDGMIGVTCEFCSTKRVFDPADYASEPLIASRPALPGLMTARTPSPERLAAARRVGRIEAELDALLGSRRATASARGRSG